MAWPETKFTLTDHIGTPILQTSSTGTVVWRAEYEPYGNVYAMRAGSAAEQLLRFPGQKVAFTTVAGEESYNIFRWYRAGWGRYTQADPLFNLGVARLIDSVVSDAPSPAWDRLQSYTYTEQNPLGYIDPLGLKVKNNTNCIIYVKEPDSGKTWPLFPGGTWIPDQDGYADPCNHPNQVFKTVDDVDVTIDKNFNPDTNANSFTAAIGQITPIWGGGWKDPKWQKKLQNQKKPDFGWDELFKKSQPSNCCCK